MIRKKYILISRDEYMITEGLESADSFCVLKMVVVRNDKKTSRH